MFELDEHEIDWRFLRICKMYLLYRADAKTTSPNEKQALYGLIGLLDYIQDSAIEEGVVPGADVFTHRELNMESVNDAPWVLIDNSTGQWLDAFMFYEKAGLAAKMLFEEGIKDTLIISKERWMNAQTNAINSAPGFPVPPGTEYICPICCRKYEMFPPNGVCEDHPAVFVLHRRKLDETGSGQ